MAKTIKYKCFTCGKEFEEKDLAVDKRFGDLDIPNHNVNGNKCKGSLQPPAPTEEDMGLAFG